MCYRQNRDNRVFSGGCGVLPKLIYLLLLFGKEEQAIQPKYTAPLQLLRLICIAACVYMEGSYMKSHKSINIRAVLMVDKHYSFLINLILKVESKEKISLLSSQI